jgi:hypothetical protein
VIEIPEERCREEVNSTAKKDDGKKETKNGKGSER